MKNQTEIPLLHKILFIFDFCPAWAPAGASSARAGIAPDSPFQRFRLAPGRLFNLPFLRATGPRKRKGAAPGEKKPRLSFADRRGFLFPSQFSNPSTFFCSDHRTGSACFSLSTLNPSGRFPVRTAWTISGASSVSRSTLAT